MHEAVQHHAVIARVLNAIVCGSGTCGACCPCMPRRGEPHHAPERSDVALLLIDVIHDFTCVDGGALHAEAQRIVTPLVKLRTAARARGVPVIYVNDNFGRWRSSFDETVAWAQKSRLGDVARRLGPRGAHLAVLKPGRSGFYASPLDLLLDQMGATTLVLAGLTTDQCVLATASDALLRKYRCAVPSDCSAALSTVRHERALALLADAFDVDVRASADIVRDVLPSVRRRARPLNP